ncbi:MAG: hypothetical protein ABSB14_17905 [Candidatus Sulfotelmatobacter sp.]|jgi:hypothetical protein
MNTPGFTAEAAIYNRPASFQMPPAGANRTPGGAVAMALNCPEDCYCLCPQAPATTGGGGGGLKIPVQIPVK